jgi:hypothetical protein
MPRVLITNTTAYKVLMDSAANRATGILYIDRETKQKPDRA